MLMPSSLASGRLCLLCLALPITLALLACAGRTDDPTIGQTPQGIAAAEWPLQALVVTNSVRFEDRARFTGDVVATQRALGPVLSHNAEMALGFDAVLTGSVKSDTLVLLDRAKITGSAQYNTVSLGSQAQIQGSQTSPLGLPLPGPPSLPNITPGLVNITLSGGQQATRNPGQYRAVSLSSGTPAAPTRLTLSGGLYQFRSLSVQNDARVECQSECEIRVSERVSLGSRSFVGPTSGVGPGNVQLLVAGGNGASGPLGTPPSVLIGDDSRLEAYLLAPNGTTRLGQRVRFRGKIATRDCLLGLDLSGEGLELPRFTGQPVDLTVREGQPASFSVAVANTQGVSYRWQRNGIDVPGPAGAQATYSIASALETDSGAQFRVKVTNAAGTVLSSSASLTVVACQADDESCDGFDDDCDGANDDDYVPSCDGSSAVFVCVNGNVVSEPCAEGTCDGQGACVVEQGVVRGRVLNPDGTPAAGAEVDLRGLLTETDSNGAFEYRDVPPGRRAILASALNPNLVGRVSVEIPDMGATDVVITMAAGQEWAPYLSLFSSLAVPEGQPYDGEIGVTYTTLETGVFEAAPPLYRTLMDHVPTRLLDPVTSLPAPTRRGPPAVVAHFGRHWAAWREPLPGGTTGIYVKPVGWGPAGYQRLIHESSAQVSDPAMHSFRDADGVERLLVVWAQDDRLMVTRSETAFGSTWSEPEPSSAVGGGEPVGAPAILRRGPLVLAAAPTGRRIIVTQIEAEDEPTPTFVGGALTVFAYDPSASDDGLPDNAQLAPVLSSASDGTTQSIGFMLRAGPTNPATTAVMHSTNGGTEWTAPVAVNQVPLGTYDAPGMAYYRGYLYLAHSVPGIVLVHRSPDGIDWDVPGFFAAVDPLIQTDSGPALVESSYPASPTATPTVELMNLESGGAPDSAFKYVLISDGYLEGDEEAFRATTEQVQSTHRTIAPFSALQNRYKMYRIFVPSRETGVNVSEALAANAGAAVYSVPRQADTAVGATAAGVWLNHENTNTKQIAFSHKAAMSPAVDAGEEPGHEHSALVKPRLRVHGYYAYDLVEELIPGFDRQRDVIHVVVKDTYNVQKDSAQPVVTGDAEASLLTWLHEMGHILAPLQDEEIAFPAMETNPQNLTLNGTLSESHPWGHHFVFDSSIPGGWGNSVAADANLEADPVWDPTEVNGNTILNAGLFMTRPSPNPETPSPQYRPSYFCIMKHTGGGVRFCPVCAEEIAKYVLGSDFEDAEYHGVYDRVFVQFERIPLRGATLEVDGQLVSDDDILCSGQVCSVEVTGNLKSASEACSVELAPGEHCLKFLQQSVNSSLNLTALQVVNGNGAPLHLFPVTDLSAYVAPAYDSQVSVALTTGEVEFMFRAPLP